MNLNFPADGEAVVTETGSGHKNETSKQWSRPYVVARTRLRNDGRHFEGDRMLSMAPPATRMHDYVLPPSIVPIGHPECCVASDWSFKFRSRGLGSFFFLFTFNAYCCLGEKTVGALLTRCTV